MKFFLNEETDKMGCLKRLNRAITEPKLRTLKKKLRKMKKLNFN